MENDFPEIKIGADFPTVSAQLDGTKYGLRNPEDIDAAAAAFVELREAGLLNGLAADRVFKKLQRKIAKDIFLLSDGLQTEIF